MLIEGERGEFVGDMVPGRCERQPKVPKCLVSCPKINEKRHIEVS